MKSKEIYWTKILDFLNTLCKSGSFGITVNQILINEVIIQNNEIAEKVLIPIEA